MFQPQATPYSSSLATYGASSDAGTASVGYQLGLDNGGGGPILFSNPTVPTFKSAGGAGTAPNSRRVNRPSRQHQHMMAAQQAAAGPYQPESKGPLVGERESSHAITAEYAKADAVYVAKTSVSDAPRLRFQALSVDLWSQALPQTYSHYRAILGDGNCGWRAIVYSYFEILQKLGNKDQVESEHARMLSFGPWITTTTGYEDWIWEDMRDEVLSLLKDISDTIGLGLQSENGSLVLQRLNTAEISNSMMYWFRLVASAWLKADPERYQGFIPEGMSVDGYRHNVLEPTDSEIDHLGMSLLIDSLLKPVGMAVEVVYLDRSKGTQVNVHMFQELDANDLPVHPNGPVIHLLYRPGHYDILYKDDMITLGMAQQQILDEALAAPNVQVNRVGSFSHQHEIQATPMSAGGSLSPEDYSLMMSIPGYSMIPSHHGFPSFNSDYEPIPSNSYSLEPSSASMSVSPTSPVSPIPSAPMFPSSGIPIHSMPSYHSASTSKSSNSNISSHTEMEAASGVQIRPSRFELEPDWKDTPAPTCQTATFKNSPFNTAHYNNPNFQPEEYVPESPEIVGRHTRRREGSSRSS
ncbi:MAG: hypothetical protein M1818_001579 [Claussenomyces sp. TS43310]|nr:MAG: hypothetical protein M1818_001579 [Claussenomyces sp. TS43310]